MASAVVFKTASKLGVIGFTVSLAAEVRSKEIRVLGIWPGHVATDMQVEVAGERIGIAPERVAERIVGMAKQKSPHGIGRCVTIL